MPDWTEDVIPASFSLHKGRYGEVYRAASKGPSLAVRRFSEGELPSDCAKIVIEYEDHLLAASDTNPVVRLAFHPRDARHLCRGLLQALSDGGDRVAIKTLELLQQARISVIEENQPEEEEEEEDGD